MPNQFNVIPPIPRETERSARAIFGRKNFYILTGEHLDFILENIQQECLLEAGSVFPQITFFQFLEGLTDAQAIDAIRTRLDWKFALHLRVYPPTFREDALCEFRQRILSDLLCQYEFQRLIDRLVIFLPPVNNKLQTFSISELVPYVCSMNRLDYIHVAMRRMLEVLAIKFPDWLRKVTLPHWYGRYSHKSQGFEINSWPDKREFSREEIAADIEYLLNELHRSSLSGVSELQEVKVLEHIWMQQSKSPLLEKKEILQPKDCTACVHNMGWKEA